MLPLCDDPNRGCFKALIDDAGDDGPGSLSLGRGGVTAILMSLVTVAEMLSTRSSYKVELSVSHTH